MSGLFRKINTPFYIQNKVDFIDLVFKYACKQNCMKLLKMINISITLDSLIKFKFC